MPGYAHSVEVWDEDGKLGRRAYGVAVGSVFFTESSSRGSRDASKVGLVTLNCAPAAMGLSC